ncbi:fructosamine kinase family protein [Actinomyces gerencseriae]|uniref:fructosamine kinase family protein n=1 Tax=Actinomyces gerencseriae TaxID=52769 RepID=UPI000413DBEF|nr:fructosamine kinase family protein [Actinomyces gerencseriae]
MSSAGPTIRKHDDLPGATGLEALGLTWLAEPMADGGAHVVPVTAGPGWIDEPRLAAGTVTASAAEAFGRALAVTHAAGAPVFGAAPPGWDGRTQMGRSNERIRPCEREPDGVAPRRWGEFFADDRLVPYLEPCLDRGSLTSRHASVIERVCERLRDGDFDADQPALVRRAARERGDRVAVARTHGDLWTGNVMWVPERTIDWAPPRAGRGRGGVPDVVGVLIDPLAQGAHAETDLAALGVFGQRHLERIIAGYDEVSPLADGWRERVGLHQLHMLIIHAFLFGGSYGAATASVAGRYT